MIEALEPRRLLSTAVTIMPEQVATGLNQALSTTQVQTILGHAISQGIRKGNNTEVAVVVDREGTVLGMLASNGAVAYSAANPQSAPSVLQEITALATVRARTSALFESSGEAFTTRTARFIIQNNFPPGVADTPGGPLYGVQYSDLVNSDILSPSLTPGVSGDPGGVPLYIDHVPVGAIGVAGDFHDVAATNELLPLTNLPGYPANPKHLVYKGTEEYDFDEAVAQAGAKGFATPPSIRANNIFVDGIRLPFVAEPPAHGDPNLTFDQLVAGGASTEGTSIITGTPEQMNAVLTGLPGVAGVAGLLRNRGNVQMSATPGVPEPGDIPVGPQTTPDYPIIAGNPGDFATDPAEPVSDTNPQLTGADVTTIISQAVAQALKTRAGIRKPNGINAEVHVVVVDAQGDVLGAFRMNDATNFSYDVAVQKARTAAFFSDDTHAFSTRTIGFMAQKHFPPAGIDAGPGPLFKLQNDLDESSAPLPGNPLAPVTLPTSGSYSGLANGITIFPGGFPLYKNGKLVGAVGVSGDGVDQDDLIAYAGANGYQPAANIRSDSLSAASITSFITARLQAINAPGFDVANAHKLMAQDLPAVRLPYAKFPRNPTVNH